MNISFDAQPLIDGEKTGIGFCQAETLKALLANYPDHQYSLEYFDFPAKPEKLVRLSTFKSNNCTIEKCNWFYGKLYRFIWNFIPIPYKLFFNTKPAVTHFFNYFVPPGVYGKRVVTVHDMGYKAYPETVRFKTKIMLKLSLKRSCRRADKIITDSEFSKREIIKYLNISESKLIVVPCGVDHKKFKPQIEKYFIEEAKQRYNIPGNYFLYLGTLEPRKNIERIVEAYAALKTNNPDAPSLVIAGRKGWMYDSIFQQVKNLNMQQNVIFTGYIRDGDAPLLHSGAVAFLFPSLYEGFGLPPLEAMACGTPVITSNCASLPEVVGEAAILVNPYSIEELTDAMEQLILNEELRLQLCEEGLKQAQKFTWERAADTLHNIYEELVQ